MLRIFPWLLFFFLICHPLPSALAQAKDDGRVDFLPVDDLLFQRGGEAVKASFYRDFLPGELEHRLLGAIEPRLDIFDLRGRFQRSVELPGGRQARSNTVPLPDGGLAYLTRRDRTLWELDGEGRLRRQFVVRGKLPPGRRISEFDARIYRLDTRSVYLDFLRKRVAWEAGNGLHSLGYTDLSRSCQALSAGGRLYLLDPLHRLIVDLQEPERRFTGEVICGSPTGLLVVDRVREQVLQYDPDGELRGFFGPLGKDGPFASDATALPDGRIAVLDRRDARIYLYRADGTRQAVFGKSGREAGALLAPQGILADGNDRLIIRDPAGERAAVFTADGRFVNEWRDIISGREPESLRLYIDDAQKLHRVDWTGKRHFAAPADSGLLSELDRIFDSAVRYPRDMMTLTGDGGLLYLDTARNRYECLRLDGQSQTVDVRDSLAQIHPIEEPELVELARAGGRYFLRDADGRLLALDTDDSARQIALEFPVARLLSDEGGILHLLDAQGRIRRLDLQGNVRSSPGKFAADLVLAAGGGFFYQARGSRLRFHDRNGRERTLPEAIPGQILSVVPRGDSLFLYYEREGALGVFRCRRKDVYMEALRYYNHSMFRMAAVRFERMLARGLDGPDVRYHLVRCYHQLQREDLAAAARAELEARWPDAAEVRRLKEGNPR